MSAVTKKSINACANALIAIIVGLLFSGTTFAQTTYTEGGTDWDGTGDGTTYTISSAGTYNWTGVVTSPGDLQDRFSVFLNSGLQIASASITISGPGGFNGGYGFYANSAAVGSGTTAMSSGIGFPMGSGTLYNNIFAFCNFSGGNTWLISMVVTCTLPISTSMSPSGTLCIGSSATVTASGADTYTWAPSTGLSATTGTTVTASPTTTTTYTITGASSGCTGTTTRTITVSSTIPTVTTTVSPTGNICAGSSKTITASGATTYSWTPATGLSATTGATVTASPTTTTTYTVTGTTSGCSDQATRSVTVLAAPTVTISASLSASMCVGDTSTLTASGAVSYTWTPATSLSATTGATVVCTSTVTRTYTITGTGSNGCTKQVTQTVTVNTIPSVATSMSPTGNLCMGSSKTLTASGATTYSWVPSTGLSATTGATVTASPYSSTTYTVTGANGVCTNVATRTINVINPPNITSTSALLGIPGSNVTITGTGFNGTNANNIVYFGATRATVTGSATTSLTATVPLGATYKPITLNNQNCDLTGYSQYPFLPTYNNSAYAPSTVNFAAKTGFTAAGGPFNIAIGDIDGDGKPDMAVTESGAATVSVYRNTSSSGSITSGSFAAPVTFATGDNPLGIAIADLDGDGKPDMVVANNFSNTISVFRNTSSSGSVTSSSFAPQVTFATGNGPIGLALADMDEDGRPDIAVTNYYSNSLSILRNTSSTGSINSGSFAGHVSFATGLYPIGIAIDDIDGDGKPDLAMTNESSNTISVRRNTSSIGSITTGSFSTAINFSTGLSPEAISIGDIDGDGKPDMVVAENSDNTVSVYRNISSSGSITSGSFAARVSFTTGAGPFDAALGDMDGDGKPDVVVANNASNTVSLLRNTSSSGSITLATQVTFAAGATPYDVVVGDIDADGKSDLAITSYGDNSVSVLRNNPLSPITGTASACPGTTTTLSNATTGGTWSSSNTAVATVGSTTGVVTGVAAGTVTITYAGTAGASFAGNRVTTTVTVNTLPTVNIAASPSGAICSGSSKTLTASGASTYTWAPATGLSATTGATVTASPTTTTIYTVTGTASTGCTDQATRQVSVNALPTVTTSTSPSGPICRGDSKTLTASGASTYTWAPATGLSATTGTSVTASPTTTVTYTITGTDANGCVDQATRQVSVNALPTAAIAMSPTGNLCIGGSKTLTASGASTYTWAPATALSATTGTTVTASPTVTTTYTVTGTDANGCSDEATRTITVIATPTVTTTVSPSGSICMGSSKTITASGATTYTWAPATGLSATTGATVTASPTVTTTYTVTGTTSGCTDQATRGVTVIAVPTVTASASPSGAICRGDAQTLTAAGAVSYTWIPATNLSATTGTSVTASPTTTVTYTITGTAANGCTDQVTQQVSVNALPTVTNTMTPTGALCMGSSKTVAASGAVSYTWAPATGLSATTGSSVTATPYSTTTYTITGTNAAGCTDESTRTITVTAPPEITSTSATLGIPGTAITITGTGFNATNANNIVYFGATRATVTGSTTTSLTATVPTGATYMPITLNNQNCDLVGYAQYPFLPTYDNSPFVSATVNFATQVTFSLAQPPQAMAIGDLDGDGKVDMVVTNILGVSVYRNTSSSGSITSGSFAAPVIFATDQFPKRVTIDDIDGDGKPDLVTTGDSAVSVFRNTSSSGSITSGSFATGVTFEMGDASTGIAIGDIDGDGKPDLAVPNFGTNTVSVRRNTGASGSITSGSFAAQVMFATGSGPYGIAIGDIDGDGKPDLAVTNRGSSSVSVLRNTSSVGSISLATQVTFATGGFPFRVTIGDIDGDGKPDLTIPNSSTNTISVLRNTSTSGSITSGSFAPQVTFVTGSQPRDAAIGDIDGDGKPDIVVPNWGGDTISVYRNTSISGSITSGSFATQVTFTTGYGPIAVTIGDIDGDGKSDLAVVNSSGNSISVLRNNPLSLITGTTSVCPGSTTTLSNATSGGTWSSSNTAIATVGSSTGVVTGVASGTVTITYAGTAGASFAGNRVTTIVTVLATPTVTTSASPGGGICIGSSQAITASGATTYTWIPATGLSAITGATVTASPTITTTYTITGTTSGCAGQAIRGVTVNALPTISAGAAVTICRLSSTTLTATGGSTYTWSPATGLTATTGATVTASPTTTVTYTITGTDANGCVNTATKMVSVNALPTISAGAGVTICSGNSTSMTATGGTTYTWAPNTALSATTGATVTASPTSTVTYTVAGTNANGCSNTATKTVTVNAIPTITAGSNVTVCRGTSTTLTASGGTTYIWTPNTALSATSGSSVTATPTTTVTYTVTGTTSGCSSTATQTVSVNPLPTISAGGTVTICRFSSTTLTAAGGSTYTWSPGTGLSATTGASVTASPTTTVTYTVIGTDANSCVNTATKMVSVNATIPTITAAMAPTGNLCMGTSKTLTAAGATTYTWAPATGLSATTGTSVTASPYSNVTYTVTGTTSACSNTATVSITLTNPPAITSASAITGIPGTAITITGTGFNATNSNNIVYFGATRATVTGSSTTSLTATVPLGATYAPITLNNQNCDLTDYAQYPFLPTYNNSAFASATVNFDARSVFTAGAFPTDVAIGDLDGDGKADLAVANEGSDSIYVYRNISSSGSITSGSFATPVPFVTGGVPHDIAIGDLDGDGKADLAVANFGTNTVSVYRNTSSSGSITSGSFATQVTFSTGVNPYVVAIGDMDGDGRADLVVSLVNVDLVSVLRNKGSSGSITSSSFDAGVTFATGIRPSAVAISDIDGDGKPDVVTANRNSNSVSVLRNTSSTGSFTSGSLAAHVTFATGDSPLGLAIGDLDGDGKVDLAVTNQGSSSINVYRNTSSSGTITTASFATPVTFSTGAFPNEVAIADIDGDGKPDLAVPDYGTGTVSVYRNTSSSGSITSGSFAARVAFASGSSTYGFAAGDMDGDGKADLVVANTEASTVSVLRNNPLSPISGATGVCIGATTTLSNTASGGTWSSSNTAIATVGSFTGVVTGVAAGTVTITYAGTAGASFAGNRVTMVMTVNTPPTTTAGSDVTVCSGSSTALTASGGTTYTWTPSTALSATTGASVTASPTTTVTYTVTGTTNGCSTIATQTVSVNALPTINAGATITICRLSSATLTATGGDTYTWSPATALDATTGATVTASPTTTVTYTITGTDANGCVNTATKMVSVNALPTISAGVGVAICSGNSTSMTATGGTTYTWSPGTDLSATTGAAVTASPTATATYTVTGTNANGCVNTATKTVTVNATPTITTGSDVSICRGSSTALTASGATTYTWTPNTALSATTGASVTASPTTTVTYTVTGTTTGCTSTATQTVTVNALPTISAGAAVTICRFSSATLTATEGDTYTWSPATALDATTGATVTASPTTTVTYTVTGTDANGCSKTATKMVSVNALPAISAGVGVAICSGNSTSMSATGGTTYTWSPGADLSATTGATVTASPTTTVTYTVTGTNAIGCSNTATKTVTVNAPPAVSGGADVAICYGSSTVLSASGATAYTWSPGTGLSATTGASVTAANTLTTTYTITGTSSGCSGTATVTVTVNPLSDPGTITGASAVTVGSILTLSNVVTGGVWSSSDTAVASVDSTGSVTGISAGTVTISYITTNGCGSVSTTKTITVNALLETDITGTFTVCTGATTPLSDATVGGVWSSADEAVATVGSASGVVTGVSAGTSTITYALPGSYVTAVVSVYAMPAVITGGGSVCTNIPITLACATTGGAWSCSNTSIATVDSTGTVTGLVAGTANISYTTSGGCRSTKTITINASPSAISGSMNGCIGATNTFTCTPTGGAWVSGTTSVATINSFGQATGFAGGVSAISYILSSGCLTTSTLTINALPDSVSGTAVVCAGLTTALTGFPSGGTWSSGNTAVATVGSNTGVVNGLLLGTARITYTNASGCYKIKIVTVNAAPLAITGTAAVCVGNTTTLACPGGGTWVSSNTAVGTIGTSGIVGGVSGGITTITYTLYTGCSRTIDVTVNTAPAAIAGTANMCVGTTTTLSSTPSGGTWSSSGITVGTVGSTTGVVTGISGGAVTISYTIAGGCRAIRVVTVNNNPPSIGGTATLITGGTTTLTNVMTGGTWSSGATGIATVGSTGVVFGAGPGTAVISYTSAAGCAATKTVTVSGTTGSITGVTTLCVGSTTSLSCFPSGGTWTSANTAVATVTSTGLITGVSGGTATISYDLSGTTVTTIVTVYPMPGSVTGTAVLCASGGTTTLSCTPGGGTWSTTSVTVATVGSTTGVVTGVSAGTAVITYSTGGGCYTTREVTVNAAPAAITGAANVCPAATTTLSNVTGGGTWSSSATGTATVNSSGVVTGVAPGVATISYHVGSCAATKVVTVNSLPGSISSPSVLCSGIVDTLTVTPSGGSWSSSNTAVGTINSITGAFVGLAGGTTTVTYLLATGCRSETILTVNESPAAISGPTMVCPGIAITLVSATTGGTWSSSDSAVASISTSGVVTGLTYGTANISYTTGSCSAVKLVTVNTAFTSGLTYNICQGGTKTLVDSLPGGTWSSSNPSVATVVSGTGVATAISAGMTTITYYFGGTCSKTTPLYVQNSTTVISGPSTVCEGLTSTMSVPSTSSGGAWTSSNPSVASINLSTGVLSAVSAGVATISYTEIECVATMVVTINPVPAVITGAQFACTGLTTTLANATGGGSWTSSSSSVATVGSATGIVSGLTTGTSNISYTIPNGCRRIAIVTVAATPASITGTASMCVGTTTLLASVSPGGTWSSSNSSVASASGTAGIVSGVAAGNATITYGFGGTCISTRAVTVNAAPGAITGPNEVCAGQNITFVNTLTPGTWSSGAPGIATANSSTGLIAGVSAGTATITYTTSVGACKVTKVVTVNAAMPAITGGNTVCVGDAVTLATTASGGAWSSSVVAKATVGSATGVVTGVATGTTTITYMVSVGCYKTSLMVVNPLPAAISGASSVVAGSSTSLSCATSGGAWSSSNIAVGTVGSASGWVTGVSAGTTTISYTIITTGCRSLKAMTVNPTTLARGVAGVDKTEGVAFAVYPNPTHGAITVETSSAGVFTIYTIDGRVISEHKIETSSTYIRLPDDILSGIYLCKFTRNNGSVETVRLIYTR